MDTSTFFKSQVNKKLYNIQVKTAKKKKRGGGGREKRKEKKGKRKNDRYLSSLTKIRVVKSP